MWTNISYDSLACSVTSEAAFVDKLLNVSKNEIELLASGRRNYEVIMNQG